MPSYVLLTFTKGQVFAFTGGGLWASYLLDQVRTFGKDLFKVDEYTFNLVDFEGSLEPWAKGKEVLFSGYALVTT